ncbi:hypothetical protein FHL15_004914 [Xylaria flabelliformis]|uniref:Uncharacterized protein n=1 Tax=Xylaria flabelliformis TaxID=2512241 RepID=A0A553I1R2_9PEZI|nr:hypothetical protein FHL15_004914 [Xylaria flabelliformis]
MEEAASPKGPSERLKDLTDRVDDLEAVYKAKISCKLPTSDDLHLLRTYTETVHAMELIREESSKDDAVLELKPDLDRLFKRVMILLDRAAGYVNHMREMFTPVHKELLKLVLRINKTSGISNDGLTEHQIEMGNLLMKIRPDNEEAWEDDGQDLKRNRKFERIYKEFCNLKRDVRIARTRHELYAMRSWQLLQSAFRELEIPVIEITPHDNFFDNDIRWTCVDYPYGSHEYLYGKDGRPGMVGLKDQLGGDSTEAEREIGYVMLESDGTTEKVPIGTPIEESKKQDKEKNPPNNKRNPTDDAVSSKSKKPRIGWSGGGYTMNIVNAAADIEDCLRDSKFTSMQEEEDVDRPGSERLQTPMVETRRTTLVSYHEDLLSIVDQVYKRRFGLPVSRSKLPQTAAARGAWLTRANKELVSAREEVNSFINSATTPAKAKKLRLAAYKLKLVRAMYTVGLLSGNPAASAKEIQEGLIGRLDDWILHEEAWNVAEKTILGRSAITQETFDIINSQIEERDANIARWKELRDEVEKGPGGYDDEPAAGLDIFITNNNNPLPLDEQDEGQGEYEFGEDEINADDDLEDKKPDDTEMTDISDKDPVAKKAKEPEDPYDNVLTDQEIKNGQILLHNVLFSKEPDAGPYLLDWEEEDRRHAWYTKAAQAELAGKPPPPGNHLPMTDIFEAGGPPDYKKNPRKTRWQRLQYMIVLTYWRFYQLRLMEP